MPSQAHAPSAFAVKAAAGASEKAAASVISTIIAAARAWSPGMKNHSPPMVQFVTQGPERKQTIWRTRGQGDVFSPLEGDVSLRDDVSKSAKKQLARNVNGNAHATNGWSECELERVQCESKIFEAARPTFAGMRIHLCCGALICPTFVRACARRQVVSASPLQLHRMPRSHFLCCWFAAGLCDADPLLRIFLSFCIAQILLHHFHDASVS